MKKVQVVFICCLTCLAFLLIAASPSPQSLNPDPPGEVVKLIFIHHSCGENWLSDDYGNLGRELGENNYFVSDTNYSWGPDSIGDRTDIPNWIEWFRSSQTPAYMDALFNENGQNSYYTRNLSDPGGENRVIMFKSCFPNSELGGSPNDPPGTYEDATVSGAKYTYNEILKYFATRPDKLFIVITAPPVSDSTYARNARTFNTWLVEDWLDENDYTMPNVAVFDFYNVLTDRNAHHRYEGGQIEHVARNSNTLAYPSGDDHPSEQGSRKATEEFIPLLNIYYNLWQETAPETAAEGASAGEPAQASSPGGAPAVASLIDDFEGDSPAGTGGWEANYDAATSTSISCWADTDEAHNGSRSLAIDFDVEANSWATCSLFYDTAQDWSAAQGLTFYLHAQESGLIFDVDLYTGSYENLETYLYTIEAPPDSAGGWIPISLNWSDFHRASWEENADAPFEKPDELMGLAFGMSTYPDTPNTGMIWVDDLSLLGAQAVEAISEEEGEVEQESPRRRFSLPCGSAFALPAAVIALGLMRKKHQHE